MKGQAIMNGVDHDDVLLRFLIGESIAPAFDSLPRGSGLTLNNIVHALGTSYRFRCVADSIAQGLKRGYVEREGMRRYFDGFGSSSIEKRNAAQILASRWLLHIEPRPNIMERHAA
jgi:hypothetical protein